MNECRQRAVDTKINCKTINLLLFIFTVVNPIYWFQDDTKKPLFPFGFPLTFLLFQVQVYLIDYIRKRSPFTSAHCTTQLLFALKNHRLNQKWTEKFVRCTSESLADELFPVKHDSFKSISLLNVRAINTKYVSDFFFIVSNAYSVVCSGFMVGQKPATNAGPPRAGPVEIRSQLNDCWLWMWIA